MYQSSTLYYYDFQTKITELEDKETSVVDHKSNERDGNMNVQELLKKTKLLRNVEGEAEEDHNFSWQVKQGVLNIRNDLF